VSLLTERFRYRPHSHPEAAATKQSRDRLTALRQNLADHFSIWNARPDFEAVLSGREKKLSYRGLYTFFDEYVASKPIKYYEYDHHGLRVSTEHQDLDPPTLVEVCAANLRDLIQQNLATTRGSLELWLAEVLEHFLVQPLEQVPLGTKIVWLSPQGAPNERYPGEGPDHYAFVNMIERVPLEVSSTGFRFVQWATFDQPHQLAKLHQHLLKKSGARLYREHGLQLPVEPNEKLAHQLIAQPLVVPSTVSVGELTTLIQKRQQWWHIKLKQFPILKETLWQTQQAEAIAFCQEIFDEKIAQVQAGGDLTTAIHEFNTFMEFFREYLVRWVELNAENYKDTAAKVERQRAQKGFTSRYSFNLTQDKSLLREDLDLIFKDQRGQLLPEEKTHLDAAQQALALVSGLSRVSSILHCVVGTPASVIAQAHRLGSLTGQLRGIPDLRAVGNLSATERHELINHLDSLTQLRVLNKASGQFEVYYVLITDPSQASQYQNSCYKETSDGPVIGPCGLPLTDERETLAIGSTLLTEAEYLQLRLLLAQQNLVEAVNKNSSLEQDKKHFLSTHIKEVFSVAFTASLSDWVGGYVQLRAEAARYLPQPVLTYLATTFNPLVALQTLIDQLHEPLTSPA
jgi:hypothetical protein